MSNVSTRDIAQGKQKGALLPAISIIAIVLACASAWAAPQSVSAGGYSPTEKPKAKAFSNPEDAASAIYAAAKRDDEAQLLVILGPDAKNLVQWSDDPTERQEHREVFTKKYEQMHRLVKELDNTVALYVGSENWPLPIPLVEYQGAWYFDAELGGQEIRYRRIGRNEMEALEVCQTLLDAEKEYRATAQQYTTKFISSNDAHDGLYWSSAGDMPKSPIGPYLARAGITGPDSTRSQPFHGYYYRILLKGSDNFTILALPAEYRSSGVMTFLVSQDGRAYEKDLGEQTAALSSQLSSVGGDDSWKQVEQPVLQ